MKKGKIYLIPTSISGENLGNTLLPKDLEIVSKLECFVVETPKVARKHLSDIQLSKPIQKIQIETLDEHTKQNDLGELLTPILQGYHLGIMSDAGLPSVADPGWRLVELAQKMDIEVIPLVGPSSIMLALMTSGLNGQRFVFHGYLNREKEVQGREIKKLESNSEALDQTQIFMDAPYKNNMVLSNIFENCKNDTLLCIAYGVHTEKQLIKTKPIGEWKEDNLSLDKIPTLFLIYRRKSRKENGKDNQSRNNKRNFKKFNKRRK